MAGQTGDRRETGAIRWRPDVTWEREEEEEEEERRRTRQCR